jgi:VIT1/CCC1 family predicted Fe2+/Mn2+ transporter
LAKYYSDRGMNPEDVRTTVQAIMRSKTFLLEEMAAHELHIDPEDLKSPVSKAFWMFLSFLIAAVFPIWPYALFNRNAAFAVSVCTAIVAIFAIGAGKTVFTGLNPVKSGLAMLAVAASAGIVGYVAGHFLGVSGI